ncbi:hypothetical protein QUA56_13170 [Microcoleus sp. N3A4]
MLFLGQETKAIALHERFSSKTRFLRPGSVRKLAGVADDRHGRRSGERDSAGDRSRIHRKWSRSASRTAGLAAQRRSFDANQVGLTGSRDRGCTK